MILHTVNKSPFTSQCLNDCLNVCVKGDSVLLIEDGVYAAAAGETSEKLTAAPATLYALKADLEARGLLQRIRESITVVDDSGFVELAVRHDQVVSWY